MEVGPLVVKHSLLRGSPIFSQQVARRPPWSRLGLRSSPNFPAFPRARMGLAQAAPHFTEGHPGARPRQLLLIFLGGSWERSELFVAVA